MRVFVVSLSVLVISVLLSKYLNVNLIEQSELNTCPYCYGTDLCELLESKIKLVDDSLSEFFANRFSVKNVFYAELFEEKIVLKKLASAYELRQLDETICRNFTNPCNLNLIKDERNFTDEILNSLTTNTQGVVADFKVCSEATASVFLQEILSSRNERDLKHIWTTLQVNAEPLLLQVNQIAN